METQARQDYATLALDVCDGNAAEAAEICRRAAEWWEARAGGRVAYQLKATHFRWAAEYLDQLYQ